jgi:hypothetical protein
MFLDISDDPRYRVAASAFEEVNRYGIGSNIHPKATCGMKVHHFGANEVFLVDINRSPQPKWRSARK